MDTPATSPALKSNLPMLSQYSALSGAPELPTAARNFLDSLRVWPVFQPIVDLYQQSVIGYEVLSRGQEPMNSPAVIFTKARELSLRWETEGICRLAAFKAIHGFEAARKGTTYFLNISPEVLSDVRLVSELSVARLAEFGLCPEQIVLEVTEEVSLTNYLDVENTLARLRGDGFRIAIDDFGCGSANLYSIVSAKPEYLKLDMSLVRDIHTDSHKLKMVRTLLHLCEDMNTRLVAEGVEKPEELDKLASLGVRFVQGYFLGMPRARPMQLEPEVEREVAIVTDRLRSLNISNDTVRDIMQYPPAFEEGRLSGEELYHLFSKSNADHVVILRGGRPAGLITRSHFMANTSGAFGYSLLQRRPADRAAKYSPLCVPESISIVELAKTAMERPQDDVYDPVLVVDRDGVFQGTVAMRMLILRASRMEIDLARDCNPLTGLPGNRRIIACIERAIREERNYCVVYFDLNRFKEFNDVYGFAAGDEIIRLTGDILKKYEPLLSNSGMLGHVGGDDFIYVCSDQANALELDNLCREFDREKRQFFRPEHLRQNSYQARDRQGNVVWVPLVTLSASAVTAEAFGFLPHPAQIAKAAATLKKITKDDCKDAGMSKARFERRVYATPEELC